MPKSKPCFVGQGFVEVGRERLARRVSWTRLTEEKWDHNVPRYGHIVGVHAKVQLPIRRRMLELILGHPVNAALGRRIRKGGSSREAFLSPYVNGIQAY